MHADDPVPEEDLWFLPGPPESQAAFDAPWPVAAREASLDPATWRQAEAAQFRALIAATDAVTRFGERLGHLPDGVAARFGLRTVSHLLQGEGLWLGPETIALHQVLRIASADAAQDLARAGWAVRRLRGSGGNALASLRDFLGRSEVRDPQRLSEDQPVGAEFDALGQGLDRAIAGLGDVDPLTRAAYGFALWRREGITPWEQVLEPSVAALCIGAEGRAPFLPMAPGHRLDRHGVAVGAGAAEARLATFYAAAEAGALNALLELRRLEQWRDRAAALVRGQSGRVPRRLAEEMLRYPVVSAELLAATIPCAPISARRALARFETHGLVREVTGQERYRFWTVSP